MALTDHNTIKGCIKVQKVAPKDFLVIPSVEISTADGHLLAFNVTENIQGGLSVEETVERVIDAGGEPIVPHLFRLLSGIKKEKLIGIQSKVSAIEVFNGCSVPSTNLKTAKVARAFNGMHIRLLIQQICGLIRFSQKLRRKKHGEKDSLCHLPTDETVWSFLSDSMCNEDLSVYNRGLWNNPLIFDFSYILL